MFELLKKKLKNLLGVDEKKPQKKKTPSKKKEPRKKKEPSKRKGEKIELSPKREELKEEPAVGFFSKLTARFNTSKITEEQVTSLFDELELILLENNVALEVVDQMKVQLVSLLVGKEVKKEKLGETVTNALKEAIATVLQEPEDLIEKIKNKQGVFTIVFFGINGSGKTTSLAKLAHYLKKNKISSVVAAGDTFRAASIEQLGIHAEKIGVPIIKQTYGSDPAAVAFDAIRYAEKNGQKVVLIDTAGRMYTKENLIREMEKIIRVVKPDLKIFVGESITGNDATEQARTFNEAIGIDGIILTKADVDDKGGTALSVSYITKKPIYFLGMGQGYDDLKPFKKEIILKNLGV